MYYKSGNTLIKSGTTYFKQVVKQLTFQVEGSYFPLNPYNTSVHQMHPNCTFMFYSSVPNTVTVNFGDGSVMIKEFIEETPGVYVFGWRGSSSYYTAKDYDESLHIFQDANTQTRNISFEFENLSAIYENPLHFCGIIKTPLEWEYTSLTELNILNTLTIKDIERVPSTVTNRLRFQNAFSQKKTQIPDQWFSATNVRFLYFANSFDFSDNLASNLYKINQFPLAEIIDLNNCDLTVVPESINELNFLRELKIESNDFVEIPTISNPNIEKILLFGNNAISNPTIPDWSVNEKLQRIDWNFASINPLDFSDLSQKWKGLKSISTININFFSEVNFNQFIESFYQLVIENGFLDPSSQEAIDSGWPNQFRSISWGNSSLNVDSPIVAPSGFVQGVSNGTPTTNGERVYVLMANYSHVTPY